MKVAILCGGKGTRLAELTERIPKGLIAVGERPIIWHIMKYFASFGHTHFVLLAGYMAGEFVAYFNHHREASWTVEFVDSGEEATKSRRLMDARSRLENGRFFLAYGDDLSDVDLDAVLAQNDCSGAVVTLTAVRPKNPFGTVSIAEDGHIERFEEKGRVKEWINGGYMVVRPGIFEYLNRGELEPDVFPALAADGAMDAYKHAGFWMSMNTFKECHELGQLWRGGRAPWKRWSAIS